MSLSAHSVQRDPAESSLCSLRPGVLQRCEQDLWSLSKHMAQTLSDLTVVSLVSRDCFKEQGGVQASPCSDCPYEGFYLKSSTTHKNPLRPGTTLIQMQNAWSQNNHLQSGVLGFLISLSLSSRQWHKDVFGKPSLLNIYMFLSDHIYDNNPIVSQLTQKLHLSRRGNRQVWLEERSEISILGRAPHRVFAIQAVLRLHCQHHPQEDV